MLHTLQKVTRQDALAKSNCLKPRVQLPHRPAFAPCPCPGSLSLETAPLKNSLRSEAASWKAQFAQNLHRQCSEDLKAFDK
jgi:hypothetical protein